MGLAELQAEVESYRAAATELAEDFARAHAEVADDPNLTPIGRRERLEPLHNEVSEKIGALHAREKAAVKAMKETLERRVFGLSASASSDPAKVVSFRDAQARARELEDRDEAEEIYQSALRSGDSILATAVLEKALIRGWSTIKDDYLQRNTTTRGDLEDLAALAKYTNNGFANITHYAPPSLNLPHAAGFPNTQLHRRGEPTRPPNLADQMAQRLGIAR